MASAETTVDGFEVTMPQLSDSMEEGTILQWLVAPGATVEAGEDLVEIETDKANMTCEAEASGAFEAIAAEGETLPVGAPIARIGGAAESSPEPEQPKSETNGDAALAEEPAPAASSPGPAAESTAQPAPAANGEQPAATPLARRIAATHGVDLAAIGAGGGPRGRIVKADVLAAAGIEAPPKAQPKPSAPEPAAPAPAAPAPVEGAKGEATVQELTRLQTVIARRMSEAKATAPHFQVETEVRMDAAFELRAQLKRIAEPEPAPSINDLIVKATGLALREHPKANGSYRDGRYELHRQVNVGIAVATDEALVVPTVTDADSRSLGEIGRVSRGLAERVRSGKITPPELAGGTFTVSNLGMLGVTAMNPVINLPQAAILGVGATRPTLLRGADGEIEDASMMTLTLSCDHRILYGAEGAAFLASIKAMLEAPLLLAL